MIPNLVQVSVGLWRGGQPETIDDWRQLYESGIRYTLKLNVADSGQSPEPDAIAAGIQVSYMPIDWVEQILGEPPHDFLKETSYIINACKDGGGILVHCTHGQDRTGLIIGAYRVMIEGWTKAAAYQEMLDHGFHPLLRGLCWAWDAVPENKEV